MICVLITILQIGLSCKKLLRKVMTSSWKKGVKKIYPLWLTSKPRTQLGGCPGKPPCNRAVPRLHGWHSCWLGSATRCCALRPPLLGAPWYRQQDTPAPSNGQSHRDFFLFTWLPSPLQRYLEVPLTCPVCSQMKFFGICQPGE